MSDEMAEKVGAEAEKFLNKRLETQVSRYQARLWARAGNLGSVSTGISVAAITERASMGVVSGIITWAVPNFVAFATLAQAFDTEVRREQVPVIHEATDLPPNRLPESD